MSGKVRCPECGSTKVWKVGTSPSRSGPKQRYACTNCGRRFGDRPAPKKTKPKSKKK